MEVNSAERLKCFIWIPFAGRILIGPLLLAYMRSLISFLSDHQIRRGKKLLIALMSRFALGRWLSTRADMWEILGNLDLR